MPSRPRVLVLITKADVGGAQVHVLEILRQLQKQFNLILACGETGFLTEQAIKLGIEVRVLKHLKRPIDLFEDSKGLSECTELLQEIKPDLLHLHSSKAGVLGRLAAWRTNTKVLFTAHGWAFTQGAPSLQRGYGLIVESILCRLIGDVVTISKYDDELAKRYKVGKTEKRHLIINGVSDVYGSNQSLPSNAQARQNNKALNILSVGRLSPVKNHDLLLHALAKLALPFQASIVGEGQCRAALEKTITELDLSNKVTLLGEVTDIAAHLSAADVFVLSSNYEGLPLSILEAMSHSLPIIASDVGGVSEAVIQDETGLLFPRGDAKTLAKHLSQLSKNKTDRLRFGKQAREHYLKHFTAKRMISQLQAVYKNS